MDIDYRTILSEIDHRKYRYIGSGSGRRVFDLGDGHVIKVAKNKKGIAQNEVEHRISRETSSKLFAPVISMSEDARYLIMEKAERVYSMSEVMWYFGVRTEHQLLKDPDIHKIILDYDLVRADILRKSSWGFVGDELVIIDYGFTRYVRERYYRRHHD